MFKIIDKNEVWWPVNVPVPANGGKTTTHRIDLLFLVPTQEDIDNAMDIGKGGQIVALKKSIRDWKEIGDEKGSLIPFNEETLNKLLNMPYLRQAAYEALLDCATGGAISKN
jgi:hypothetical protein